jgi:peroxiredoxin
MGKKLEVVGNVFLILVAALVGYTFLKDRYFPNRPALNTVQAGSKLSRVDRVDWTGHDRTVIIALRKDCHFCEESVPFYQRLLQTRISSCSGEKVGLLAVSPDDPLSIEHFTKESGISLPVVANVKLADLGVSVTPTTLLVDRNGEVLKLWTGMLSPKNELEVLDQFREKSAKDGRCE